MIGKKSQKPKPKRLAPKVYARQQPAHNREKPVDKSGGKSSPPPINKPVLSAEVSNSQLIDHPGSEQPGQVMLEWWKARGARAARVGFQRNAYGWEHMSLTPYGAALRDAWMRGYDGELGTGKGGGA